MPAIWSSSERPISVRMVWVDGVRHAILSQDDPVLKAKRSRRRPRSTQSTQSVQSTSSSAKDKSHHPLKFRPYKSSSSSQAEASFDGCFVKLRLVADNRSLADPDNELSSKSHHRRRSAPICTRLPDRFQLDYECKTPIQDADERVDFHFDKSDTPQMNTLSERVLQWLDLSGKVRRFEGEKKEEKIVNKQKYSNAKEASLVKIILPSQCLILEEKSTRREEKEFGEKKSSQCRETSKTNDGISEDDKKAPKAQLKTRKNDFVDYSEKTATNVWTMPRKPQLHIFMPTLKTTEIQWMSSQESLFRE